MGRGKGNSLWDFPGGPVAKTVFPTQGAWVQSLVRELDSHMPQLRVLMLQLRPDTAI